MEMMEVKNVKVSQIDNMKRFLEYFEEKYPEYKRNSLLYLTLKDDINKYIEFVENEEFKFVLCTPYSMMVKLKYIENAENWCAQLLYLINDEIDNSSRLYGTRDKRFEFSKRNHIIQVRLLVECALHLDMLHEEIKKDMEDK